jgi:hypothetical protein
VNASFQILKVKVTKITSGDFLGEGSRSGWNIVKSSEAICDGP